MEITLARRITLDGKRHEEGKKITVDDETGEDLIRLGYAKPKPAKPVAPTVAAKPA